MAKRDMNDLLKRRMSATQQAAEVTVGDEAYEMLFQGKLASSASKFCDLPLDRLRPFFTADIGFHPYPQEKLKAFSQQLAEQGIYERIIVRPIPESEDYETLAGHNRTEAWRLTGHATIPAEVVDADDARAVSIAVATNLLRRQDLTIIERGKAYRALLTESNRNGQRNVAYPTFGENRQRLGGTVDDLTSGENRQKWGATINEETFGENRQKLGQVIDDETIGENRQRLGGEADNLTFGDSRQKLEQVIDDENFGENRQRYNARKLVADFFGVTEYEIRKAIKLAGLIPPLADILENSPRKLPIACAELIADYDAATQQAFVEMCSIEDYTLNKAAMQSIVHTCPPPSAKHQDLFAAWRQARARETQRRAAQPKKISFDRRKFAPYLERLGSDKEIEELFLEFLRQRVN